MIGLVFRIVLILTVTGSAWAQDNELVTLRWKLEAGADLVYQRTTRIESEAPTGETMWQSQVTTDRWSITEVADTGDMSVSVTIDRIQLVQSGPQGDSWYDSAGNAQPTDPQTRMMATLVGTTSRMTIGKDGTIKAVDGFDEILDNMVNSLGQDNPAMATRMRRMLGSTFSDDAMKTTMQQSIPSFPDDPVGRGATWNQPLQLSMPPVGMMDGETAYTLERFEQQNGNAVAVFGVTGAVDITPDADSPVARMVTSGNVQMEGTMSFDVDRGVMLTFATVASMDMTMKQASREMTLKTTSTTIVELLED